MAETVAQEMPTAAEIAANTWLSDEELRVYREEYSRNGFQGGLQSYRTGAANGYSPAALSMCLPVTSEEKPTGRLPVSQEPRRAWAERMLGLPRSA